MNYQNILSVFFIFISFFSKSQGLIEQDIFKGEVFVYGFATHDVSLNFTEIEFPHNGIIKDAYILTYSAIPDLMFIPKDSFQVNNFSFGVTSHDIISYVQLDFDNNLDNTGTIGYKIFKKNILPYISSSSSSLSIKMSSPLVSAEKCPICHLSGFVLVIKIQDEIKNPLNFQQIINENPESISKTLNCRMNVQPLNNCDIGLGIMSDRLGSNSIDGYSFKINNSYVCKFNQNDSLVKEIKLSGVMGCFHYTNGVMEGLCDDNPILPVGGSNGIMKLNSFLPETNFELKVEYLPNYLFYPHNILLGYNLVYSTPCEPFEVVVPSDTTLCQGASLSLQASGGQRYKWLPETGLSCYDCANPTFTADSTTFYSLQIFNSDSCSVIRTVRLFVEEPKSVSAQSTNASFCGGATGSVIMQSNAFYPRYSVNGTLFPSGNNLQNLASGNYTVVGISAAGCPSFPIQVAIDSINTTVADFWRTPLEGSSPLNVSIENKSQQATNFLWQVDTLFFQNIPNPYTFTEAGWHTITLYAWKYDTLCADTVSKTVFVRIAQIIPTAFTPNNDGDNDVWELPYIDVLYPENQVFVYNRWGNLLYSSKKGAYATNPWDGTFEGKPLPVGSYFYVIETNNPDYPKMNGQVSVIRK